jgi:hypothetical protein
MECSFQKTGELGLAMCEGPCLLRSPGLQSEGWL